MLPEYRLNLYIFLELFFLNKLRIFYMPTEFPVIPLKTTFMNKSIFICTFKNLCCMYTVLSNPRK